MVNLEEGLTVCSDLQSIMKEDITSFENSCAGSPGSLDPILLALGGMQIAIAGFILIGFDAQDLLKCEGLNSIYIGLTHGSACTHMPETLAWMFCTMFIILISGMTLFTLRAALLPDKIVEYWSSGSDSNGSQDQFDERYLNQDMEVIYSSKSSNPDDLLKYKYSIEPSILSNNNVTPIDDDDTATSSSGGEKNMQVARTYDDIEDIEIKRLPTTQTEDVEIQVSSRNLGGTDRQTI